MGDAQVLREAGGIPDVDPSGKGLKPAPGDRELLLEGGAEGIDLGGRRVVVHGSTLSCSGSTLRSVGEVLEVLDELHLELEERSVVRVVPQVNRGVEPHPLADGIEAFEDELRFGAGEVFHGSSITFRG